MPTVLVTGATGLVGSHVARLLIERGDAGLDIETVTADILDRRALRRAFRDVDRLFHVAGLTSPRAPADQVARVNVQGTRVVLEEALRAGVERAVVTSSVAAIGPARAARAPTSANRSPPAASTSRTCTPAPPPGSPCASCADRSRPTSTAG